VKASELQPTEHQIQSALCQLLDVQARPDMIWFAIPNGGHRHIAVAKRMKAEGVKRGVPDMLFLQPTRIAWLELKIKNGRLSPFQKAFRDRAQALGHTWSMARSIDEAMIFLSWIDALKRTPR
jgi:hypothetical protein